MSLKKSPVLFFSLLLLSCQHNSFMRNPSSENNTLKNDETQKRLQTLQELKDHLVRKSAEIIHYQKKNKNEALKTALLEEKQIKKDIENLEKTIELEISEEINRIKLPSHNWRSEEEEIELTNLSLYQKAKNVQFSLSTYEAKKTELVLTHKIFSEMKNTHFSHTDEIKPKLDFEMKCDAPFEIKYGFVTKKIKANEILRFALGDKKIENDHRKLIFDQNLNECQANFSLSTESSGEEFQFKLVNENKKLQFMKEILSTSEVCKTNKNSEKFFEKNDFTNMTCPKSYDSIKILPEPEDSLHARVVGLLGRDLPEDFVKNGNPYAELDFSNAPKLDAILVSYLVFRADFYGTLLARLMSYHADRGAFVRVIVSDVITLQKDKDMYEKLMAKHPNIKFIRYEFDKSQKGGARFSELHRTNHVKLFITYSKSSSDDSMVIVGGRNIHDGFVFKTPVNVSKFPEIVDYNGGDESWAYWRDFEMVIRGQDFTESMVRHYMNFYHINKENLVMKSSALTIPSDNTLDQNEQTMRHYISIPFKDGANLNQFYAKLIDSSKKKILISSPYFRPVKEIGEALDRAIQRGVDITIITRLDLEGDTADFILGAVNKDGVNRFINKVKVFEYTEPKVILHSKLLMIDDEVSFISSVNLNKRSFYHDLENGVIVNDSKFTKEMGEVYKDYMKISRQITEEQKIIFWKRWIIKIFDKVL